MGRMSDLVIGKPGYLVALQEVEIHGRNADGRVWAWVNKGNIKEFKSIDEFCTYVDEHIGEFNPDAVAAASGSASTLSYCNAYLAEKIKEVFGPRKEIK